MAKATAIKTREDVTAKFLDDADTNELALDCFIAGTDPEPSEMTSTFVCPRTGKTTDRRGRGTYPDYPISLTLLAKEYTNSSGTGEAALDWVVRQMKGATALTSTDTQLGWVWTLEYTVAQGPEQSADAVKRHLKVGLDPDGTIEHGFNDRTQHNTYTIPLICYGGYTVTGETV